MVDVAELSKLFEGLSKEYDKLLEDREAVRQQEEEITKRREELDRKLEGLRRSLEGLSLYTTAQDKPTELTVDLGKHIKAFTEAMTSSISGERAKTLSECCREILSWNGGWMSALQVRQSLHAAGFDFSQYTSNPLSSIHTTLKRLHSNKELEIDLNSDPTLYRWRQTGPLERKVAQKIMEARELPAVPMLSETPIGRQGNTRLPQVKGPREK